MVTKKMNNIYLWEEVMYVGHNKASGMLEMFYFLT